MGGICTAASVNLGKVGSASTTGRPSCKAAKSDEAPKLEDQIKAFRRQTHLHPIETHEGKRYRVEGRVTLAEDSERCTSA